MDGEVFLSIRTNVAYKIAQIIEGLNSCTCCEALRE